MTALSNLYRLRDHEALPGFVLLGAALLGILLVNSPMGPAFDALIHTKIGIEPFKLSFAHWVMDALMAVFFLFVSLELKREFVDGALSKPKNAALPIVAAIGGVVAPALIYTLIARGTPYINGWAIPAATDIAFALGALSLFGNRVPNVAKIFLLALAVVDDLIAVLIIALVYTETINTTMLAMGVALFTFMLIMGRMGVRKLEFYWILGGWLWLVMLHSGVHATLAGVLTALAVPFDVRAKEEDKEPLMVAEHSLRPWVQFMIMPLFAIVFAGVDFSLLTASDLTHPVALGIGLGLLIGKPVGILGACFLFRHVTRGKLPMSWPKLCAISLLAGIGFTMSLFIGGLALDVSVAEPIRLGVYGGSILSGVLAVFLLHKVLPPRGHARKPSSVAPFLTR